MSYSEELLMDYERRTGNPPTEAMWNMLLSELITMFEERENLK